MNDVMGQDGVVSKTMEDKKWEESKTLLHLT